MVLGETIILFFWAVETAYFQVFQGFGEIFTGKISKNLTFEAMVFRLKGLATRQVGQLPRNHGCNTRP